jgi:thiamine-monophosphate kinase
MSEFELIQRYFTERQSPVDTVPLGIGDDCALITVASGMQLAISTDMLIEGRHFFSGSDAKMLGHKALAVNLSDLAAMGAEPRAFTLALALPEVQTEWLSGFSTGLFDLASLFNCQLIGGDTTRGPLNICITVFGEIPQGQALKRDAAIVGDDIWVSGTLGDARLALSGFLNPLSLPDSDLNQSAVRLHMPEPRIVLGKHLRSIAHAAIDISDGLIGDLGHILKKSRLGATLWCDALPFGDVLRKQKKTMQYEFALAGGDDYELCFTASRANRASILAAAQLANTAVTRIGLMESEPGLRFVDQHNEHLEFSLQAFDHFQS